MVGLHELCRDPMHYFDRGFDLEMVEVPGRGHALWGVCRDCGRLRLVYTEELKKSEVIEYKTEGVGHGETV